MTEPLKTFDPFKVGLSEDDVFHEVLVRSILVASGGEVIGRIKLQKLVFLLDKLGLNSGFKFAYHHYGPYSAQLSTATDIAKAFGFVEEKFAQRESDGARYSIFEPSSSTVLSAKTEFLNDENVVSAINEINATNSTIVELAATAYWLKYEEANADWSKEIVRRKGAKVDNGRLDKALALLAKINLSIAN